MCGITAFFAYNTITDAVKGKLKSCNNEMSYRGPDDQDIWNNNKIALAQVRLSVIGVSNGRQPLFNEDKSLVLICNGEIYNYPMLKKELENLGHRFSSNSDCETILHLYEEYGEDLNSKLDGMFAYCLYDSKQEKLLVGRDIAGKKPLYYSATSEGIIFSSELKAIKNHFLTAPSLNFEVLRQTQLETYSISPDETYVRNIYKLPYSSYVAVSPANGYTIDIKRYFQRVIKPIFTGSYEDACLEVKRLLYKAVEKRLQSEVPVAVLLSAGIDSSAVASIAKEFKENVSVISAGYKGKHTVDERSEAKKLSDEKRFLWNELELDENDFSNNLAEILPILDEPNGDVAMFAQWEIYKKAKQLGFTVLLSGNGGDEMFYGYQAHNDYAKELERLEAQKKKKPTTGRKLNLIQIFSKAKNAAFIHPDSGERKTFERHYYLVYEELVKRAIQQKLPLEREDWHRVNKGNQLDNVYYYLHYAWLTNNCYLLADKLAMGNSIEVRSPFADIQLIKFVDSLPMDYKFRNGQPKQLLKDSLKDVLPDYVLNRGKTGFTPPSAFINNIISNYNTQFFTERPQSFAQLVTDHFAHSL